MKISRLLSLTLALVALFTLAGCGSPVSTRQVTSLEKFRRIYVEKRLNDNNHLDELLVAELRRLGRDATSGPLTMMPASNIDLVLTYDARWEWDFKTYLIECNLELRTPYANKKVAEARYYRPSIRTSPPETVVQELLAPLFATTKAK